MKSQEHVGCLGKLQRYNLKSIIDFDVKDIILYIEKTKHQEMLGRLLKVLPLFNWFIILSRQSNYNTVVTLSQVKNAEGGDIYVDF